MYKKIAVSVFVAFIHRMWLPAKTIGLSVLLPIALSGCLASTLTGALTGAAVRQMQTSDEYAVLKPKLQPPSPGIGRLFVYTDTRPPTMNPAIYGLGGAVHFSLDNDFCGMFGKTFFYHDLSAGHHEMTINNMDKTFGGFQKGSEKIEFDLSSGETKFIKINAEYKFTFQIVPQAQAEQEMWQLPLSTVECRVNRFSSKTVSVRLAGFDARGPVSGSKYLGPSHQDDASLDWRQLP